MLAGSKGSGITLNSTSRSLVVHLYKIKGIYIPGPGPNILRSVASCSLPRACSEAEAGPGALLLPTAPGWMVLASLVLPSLLLVWVSALALTLLIACIDVGVGIIFVGIDVAGVVACGVGIGIGVVIIGIGVVFVPTVSIAGVAVHAVVAAVSVGVGIIHWMQATLT